jgi:hypothetical protein
MAVARRSERAKLVRSGVDSVNLWGSVYAKADAVERTRLSYALDQAKSLGKKLQNLHSPNDCQVEGVDGGTRLYFNTIFFEAMATCAFAYIHSRNLYRPEIKVQEDKHGNVVSASVKVMRSADGSHQYTANFYPTTCSMLVNGKQREKFLHEDLPRILDDAAALCADVDIVKLKCYLDAQIRAAISTTEARTQAKPKVHPGSSRLQQCSLDSDRDNCPRIPAASDCIQTVDVQTVGANGDRVQSVGATGDRVQTVGATGTGDRVLTVGATGDRIQSVCATGDLVQPVGATGDRVHSVGATGDRVHSVGATGDRVLTVGATGDRVLTVGATGDRIQSVGVTGDRVQTVGATGDLVQPVAVGVNVCPFCTENVDHNSLHCDICLENFHPVCEGLDISILQYYPDSVDYHCKSCRLNASAADCSDPPQAARPKARARASSGTTAKRKKDNSCNQTTPSSLVTSKSVSSTQPANKSTPTQPSAYKLRQKDLEQKQRDIELQYKENQLGYTSELVTSLQQKIKDLELNYRTLQASVSHSRVNNVQETHANHADTDARTGPGSQCNAPPPCSTHSHVTTDCVGATSSSSSAMFQIMQMQLQFQSQLSQMQQQFDFERVRVMENRLLQRVDTLASDLKTVQLQQYYNTQMPDIRAGCPPAPPDIWTPRNGHLPYHPPWPPAPSYTSLSNGYIRMHPIPMSTGPILHGQMGTSLPMSNNVPVPFPIGTQGLSTRPHAGAMHSLAPHWEWTTAPRPHMPPMYPGNNAARTMPPMPPMYPGNNAARTMQPGHGAPRAPPPGFHRLSEPETGRPRNETLYNSTPGIAVDNRHPSDVTRDTRTTQPSYGPTRPPPGPQGTGTSTPIPHTSSGDGTTEATNVRTPCVLPTEDRFMTSYQTVSNHQPVSSPRSRSNPAHSAMTSPVRNNVSRNTFVDTPFGPGHGRVHSVNMAKDCTSNTVSTQLESRSETPRDAAESPAHPFLPRSLEKVPPDPLSPHPVIQTRM